jgi:hypothetical protein
MFLERKPAHKALSKEMLHQRTLVSVVIAATASLIALAEEPDRRADVARIRSVIVEFNKARKSSDGKAFSNLFSPDGTLKIGNEIVATGRVAIEKTVTKPLFWSEVTAPIIGNESVHFISSELALVMGTQSQYGSVILKQTIPVTISLKLEGKEWRIVSLWLHSGADIPAGQIRSRLVE